MASIFDYAVPVEVEGNSVRVNDADDFTAIGEEGLNISGNVTLMLKGGSGGGTVTIAPVRDTVGDPITQGAIDAPTISVAVAENQIKRVEIQGGMYMAQAGKANVGLVALAATGNVSAASFRRFVEGQ